MKLKVSPTTKLDEMTAVPTSSPARTIRTRDVRRRMFRAARRARRGRPARMTAARTIPTRTARSAMAIASGPPGLLDDLTVPHQEDAMGPRAHDRVVGDEDERLALFAVQPDQEVHDLRRRLGVQVSGRFVGPHDGRIVHERPGDRHALLLPRAELGRFVSLPSV